MVIENNVYKIYPDENEEVVVMEWDGYATSQQFREGTEIMLEQLVKLKAQKTLANIQNMVLIGMEDQKWMETDFLPRAIKVGFKACAIVNPTSYFNKVAVETISINVEREKLNIQVFDTLEEAKNWLYNLKF